jgi:hypothetical protein
MTQLRELAFSAAAKCPCIEFARAHPDQYDPEFEATFLKLVDELDPPTAT